MTEQTPKLDVKTLKYVHSLMAEEFDRLTRKYNEMMEGDAKHIAELYLAKRSEIAVLSSKIFHLIEQQEMA